MGYGDFMIPYDPKTELCKYRTPEARKEWHAARGIEDPELKSQRSDGAIQVKVPEKEPDPKETVQKIHEERAMTKEQRYRAANREKILAKQRERRAAKK